MVASLPKPMRPARKAKSLTSETKAAWFYVQPGCIEVLTQHISGGITGAKLTRAQLVRAIEIIDAHSGR